MKKEIPNTICIDTHGSSSLDLAARAIIEKLHGATLTYNDRDAAMYPFLILHTYGELTGSTYRGSTELRIDAKTELDKLVDLLSDKGSVEVLDVTDNGKKAVVTKDKATIGCTTVTFEKVNEVYQAFLKLRK